MFSTALVVCLLFQEFLMKRFRFLLLGLVFGLTANGSFAQTKEKPDELSAKAVASIAKAAQLASIARGEMTEDTVLGKTFKSPELLVAAGGLLLQSAQVLGDEMDVIDEKGETDKSATTKPQSLKNRAKDLFDEAIAMVAGNKEKAKAVNDLIMKASTMKEESRGAVGKPRTVVRTLKPGETVVITIGFKPQTPATISYDTAGGARQRCEIIGEKGRTIYDNTGPNGSHTWTPAKDEGKRMITIRLTNVGNRSHTVTVTTN
jgi:hypothetical protein